MRTVIGEDELELKKSRLISSIKEINKDSKKDEYQFVLEKTLPDTDAFLVPLSDLHIGNKNCNLDKISRVVDIILNTENCYTMFVGDIIECATKTSIGRGIWDTNMDISEQLSYVSNILKALSEKGKVLSVQPGNHEERYAQLVGINPLEEMCGFMDIPYLSFQAYVLLKIGEQKYTIFATHNIGAGRSKAGKITRAMALKDIAFTDLYISGHTHELANAHDKIYVINETTGKIETKYRHYIIASTFLEYFNGYAAMKVYQPALTGAHVISLSHTEKSIDVFS